MSNPLAGGHAGESPYRYDPAARLSLTAGYETFSYFEWRYVRYPWGLPPRDRCEWSPEICRDEARKAAQYQRLDEAIDLDDALREARLEAEARCREQRRQALTAIIGGLLVMTLVIAAAM